MSQQKSPSYLVIDGSTGEHANLYTHGHHIGTAEVVLGGVKFRLFGLIIGDGWSCPFGDRSDPLLTRGEIDEWMASNNLAIQRGDTDTVRTLNELMNVALEQAVA